MTSPFTWIASAIFAVIAVVHLYRLIADLPITVGQYSVPRWMSIVGLVIAAGLSWMLCREARGTSGP
jgi:hypothetical protein